MTTTVECVHFMVDFDGMTRHVRDLWAEGSYWKCIQTLDAMGIADRSYQELIISGKARMAQDPKGVKGVDGHIVKDNWKPNPMHCHRGQYPAYSELSKILDKQKDWAERYLDMAYIQVGQLWAEFQRTQYNGRRLDEIIRLLKGYPEEVLELAGVDMQQFRYEADYVEDYNDLLDESERMLDVDEFIAHELELASRPKPEPNYTFEHPTGAISPEGKFYTCGWMEHSWLVYEVAGLTIEAARNAGWITIAHPMGQPTHLIITYGNKELTQRQLDILADWKQHHVAAEEVSTGAGEWGTEHYDD